MIKYPPATIYTFNSLPPVFNKRVAIKGIMTTVLHTLRLKILIKKALDITLSSNDVQLCVLYRLNKEIQNLLIEVKEFNIELEQYK